MGPCAQCLKPHSRVFLVNKTQDTPVLLVLGETDTAQPCHSDKAQNLEISELSILLILLEA